MLEKGAKESQESCCGSVTSGMQICLRRTLKPYFACPYAIGHRLPLMSLVLVDYFRGKSPGAMVHAKIQGTGSRLNVKAVVLGFYH